MTQNVGRAGQENLTRDPESVPRRGRKAEVEPRTWRQMQRDYEESDALVQAIADHYAVAKSMLAKHASRYGWSRPPRAAPAPLLAPPDPAQVVFDENGNALSAWHAIAHDAQRPPRGEWITWLFQGGRGAGKTRAGAEWLAARAEATPGGVFALVGPTMHDLREVMIEGVSGLRNLPGRERPIYEHVRKRLSWKNGATAYTFSAEEPERLRGPQFAAAWADEFCIWPKPAVTLANLRLALRRGERPQLVVTTTPKPIAALRALRAEPGCAITQAATAVNAEHLAPSFLGDLRSLYGGTRLAAQELEGLLVEGDGALFKAEDIARTRGVAPAQMDSVVVALDPPAGHAGSACGIVVAGRADGRYFVLADESAFGLSPLGWATRAAEAAERHDAAAIVAEANQGGDMVRATLAQAGVRCPIRLVHARHNKRTRAEPIAALYERGCVVHCGVFAALEEELMALGASEEASFDRADALVWALTALSAGEGPRVRLL